MVRTPSCDKSGLKKGTWTPEEDRKLIAYVTRYGCWNWRQLPKYAGLARCGKSCRLRWLNYLRPNIKRGNYNPEEEQLIIQLHQELGNRWSAIAEKLPGRTDNDIKNYWHTNLKKKIEDNKSGKHTRVEDKQSSSSREMEINNNTTGACDNNHTTADSSHRPSPDQSSSSVTTETTAGGGSNESSLIVEDDHDEFAFLNALPDVNFWTDPYVADIFCDPTEAGSPFPSLLNDQSDYFTVDPSCDAMLWSWTQ